MNIYIYIYTETTFRLFLEGRIMKNKKTFKKSLALASASILVFTCTINTSFAEETLKISETNQNQISNAQNFVQSEDPKVAEGEDDHNALVEWEKAYEDAVAAEAEKERPADNGGEEPAQPTDGEKPAEGEKPADAKPLGDNDPAYGKWTKAQLKEAMKELNKEFETERFTRYITMLDEAKTVEDVKAIVDEIEDKTGIIFDLRGPNYDPAEGEKPVEGEKPTDGKKPGTVAKPVDKGVATPAVTGETPKAEEKKPAENKPVSLSNPKGLAETGFDGGITAVAGALALAGMAAKRRKGDK